METESQELLTADVSAELASGKIVAFSQTERALASLHDNYDGVIFAVELPVGMAEAKAARKDIAGYRISLEKKRVDLKKPYLDYGRLLDAEAKRIAAELEALEKPIDDQIKVEEKRLAEIEAEKQRVEAKRVQDLQNRIEIFKSIPVESMGLTLEVLKLKIEEVKSMDLTSFEEFAEAVSLYREHVLDRLNLMLSQREEAKRNHEAAEQARIERENQVRETHRIQTIKANIEEIKSTVQSLIISKNINGIGEYSNLLAAMVINESNYGEFVDDAVNAANAATILIADFLKEQLQKEEAEKEDRRINDIKYRIQLISSNAQNLHKYPLAVVKNSLKDLQGEQLLESSFQEFYGEAQQAMSDAIEALESHIALAQKAYDDAAELAAMRAQKQKEEDEKAAESARIVAEAEKKKPEEIIELTVVKSNGDQEKFSIVDAFEDVSDEDISTRQRIIDLCADYFDISVAESEEILIREFSSDKA